LGLGSHCSSKSIGSSYISSGIKGRKLGEADLIPSPIYTDAHLPS